MNKHYKKTIDLYNKFGKKYVDDTYQIEVKELPEFIQTLKPNSLILDVGCSGGRDSKKFIEAGHRVIGIDVVEKFIKEAKRRVPKGIFIVMDLTKLKFPQNYFDAIWAQAVLLHFDGREVQKITNEFYNKLKFGGTLHVRLKKGIGVKMIKEKLVDNNVRQFFFYSKNEVEKFFKEAKFKIIASRIFPDELGRKDAEWVSVWGQK